MSQKTVCVLGGGIGGVVAAVSLKKALGKAASIILIDKNPEHIFAPSFLWVLAGQRSSKQIMRPLERLRRKGIDFVNQEILKIDPIENSVILKDRLVKYDYLVLALGAESNMPLIDGLEEAAINFYSLEGINRLRKAIDEFDSGEAVILVPSNPYKCPAAPYEAAFLLDTEIRQKKQKNDVNISIYTIEPLPMPGAGPQIGKAIKGFLESRDIKFFPNMSIDTIDPASKIVNFKGGEKKRADLLVTVPPHKAPAVVIEAGLADNSGWIPVDNKTLETKYKNIFAVGDVTKITLEGRYKQDKPLSLPKAGVFAHEEALVVAENIASDIRNEPKKKEFNGNGSCFLELGDGSAGYAVGNFYAVPHPVVKMRKPSRRWHLYKVFFEKYWFWRWF